MKKRNAAEWLPRYDELVKAAWEARKAAYAPYSRFAVGAALLLPDGRVYTGCNVENAAYPVGLCAERTAFAKAVSEGERTFSALAVIGAPTDKAGSDFCPPCGMCRQFLREFCPPDFPVLLAVTDENGMIRERKLLTLSDLLPDSFGPDNLG